MVAVARFSVCFRWSFLVVALVFTGCAPKFNFSPSLNVSEACVPSGSYQLAFSDQPSSSVLAGAALSTGGTLRIVDSCGNPASTGALSSATITLSDSSGNGNIAGVTSVTLSGGVATIPNNTLMFEKSGTTTLAAVTTVSGYGTLSTASNPIAVATPSLSTVSAFSGPDDPSGDVDGNGTSARVWEPTNLATDGTFIYMLENSPSCVIRRYDIASTSVDTWLGSLYNCSETDGSSPTVESYGGGAVSDGTYLYEIDYADIRQINLSTGVAQTIAGSNGGPTGYSDNAVGTSARLNDESGGLYIKGTTLYFGDPGNCRIRSIDLSNSNYPVSTVAGNGTCADNVDNASALSAEVKSVSDFAADSNYLYFIDNDSLREMSWTAPNAITTIVDGSTWDHVAGLAVVGSNLYISQDGMIREATIGTWTFTTVAGQATPYDLQGEVDGTEAVSRLSTDETHELMAAGSLIYVADYDNGALRVLDTNTNTLSTLAGTPDSGVGWTMSASAASARYTMLDDLVSDGTDLYLYAGYQTNLFDTVSMADGSNGAAKGGSWSLGSIAGQAMTMIGSTLYYSDPCEIWAVDPNTWTRTAVVGSSSCGEVEGSFSNARFHAITGITSDHSDHLYVYDNAAIKVLDLNAKTVSVLSGKAGTNGCAMGSASTSRYEQSGSYNPEFLTYLNGKIYFTLYNCDSSDVIQVDATSGTSSIFVNASLGGGLWGGGLPITTDGSSLYINDVNNAVIRKISSGGVVSTLFGSSTRQYQLDGPLGSAGTGPISDSSYTSGIYYGYGKLYILDDRGVRVVQ